MPLSHRTSAITHTLIGALLGCLIAPSDSWSANDDPPYRDPYHSWPPKQAVAAHRGNSAELPEHTLAAYRRAIDDGADVIEVDLVITKDGVLVARHENNLAGTTDVATRPEFAARRKTKVVDGISATGWFTEDFKLFELRTLRARERIPLNRPANVAYDGRFQIPTFREVIELVKRESSLRKKVIGLYPETKHPSYFRKLNLPLEWRTLSLLADYGYRGSAAPVLLQSFEPSSLKEFRRMSSMRRVQLIGGPANKPSSNGTPLNKPYDWVLANDSRTYGDMITPAGLKEIAGYAYAVSPYSGTIIPRIAGNALGSPTSFVANAHAAGLKVHTYTFRPENPFLPTPLRKGGDVMSPSERGDLVAEICAYLNAGIDGFFTDDVSEGRLAVDSLR